MVENDEGQDLLDRLIEAGKLPPSVIYATELSPLQRYT
jgi:hypothetical protein